MNNFWANEGKKENIFAQIISKKNFLAEISYHKYHAIANFNLKAAGKLRYTFSSLRLKQFFPTLVI